MQPMMKMRFRPNIEPSLPPVTMNIAMTSVYKRDRRLDSGHGGSDIFGDRRDRHIHDRTVEKHHELSGCQRRKHQPDARSGVRRRIHHADRPWTPQPFFTPSGCSVARWLSKLGKRWSDRLTPLGEYAASRPR